MASEAQGLCSKACASLRKPAKAKKMSVAEAMAVKPLGFKWLKASGHRI